MVKSKSSGYWSLLLLSILSISASSSAENMLLCRSSFSQLNCRRSSALFMPAFLRSAMPVHIIICVLQRVISR